LRRRRYVSLVFFRGFRRRFVINVIRKEIVVIVIVVGISLVGRRVIRIGCGLIIGTEEPRGGYTTGERGGGIVINDSAERSFDFGVWWPKGSKASQVRVSKLSSKTQ
jgi:hypothetical protein